MIPRTHPMDTRILCRKPGTPTGSKGYKRILENSLAYPQSSLLRTELRDLATRIRKKTTHTYIPGWAVELPQPHTDRTKHPHMYVLICVSLYLLYPYKVKYTYDNHLRPSREDTL